MADCFINRCAESKQNIKSMEFDNTIGSDGFFDSGLIAANTKIISILCSTPSYTVGFAWQNDDHINWCCSFYPTHNLSMPLKNFNVKGIILYIDES